MQTRNPTTPTDAPADPNVTTGGDPGGPYARPTPAASGRYVFGAEIARGGMGAVFRATDAALGREVAVKVLLDKFAPTSGTARRFDDEARITGQLQHPNIPAVYDVGALPDGRPFLAMNIINGETLDGLLAARGDPADDRSRWVGIFERVCEAVAYAHAHGVIHRDLKPQNVMVGAFGEVQVMDWGLAKVLAAGREAEPGDPNATAPTTAIVSQRESDDLLTQAGSVLGTPAYMAPEQAIGAVDQLDRRTDVFGLGGILASILTGQPPFVGDTPESIRQMAANRRLAECFARLDGCGAEPDLVALCKRCLAGEKGDRPADAGAVAAAVAALRAAADERAKRAELDAAEGRVRRAEVRKRRLWAGMAGVLAVGLTAVGTFAVAADRARRTAQANERGMAAVVAFFADTVFAAARPKGDGRGLGVDVTVRDAVTASLPELGDRFADQPLAEARLRRVLGNTLNSTGEQRAAVEQSERAWAVFREILGPEHPDTLLTGSDLGAALQNENRYADAHALQVENLPALTRVMGADHSATIQEQVNLAISSAAVGRTTEALTLAEQAYAAADRALGPTHPVKLSAQSTLASLYGRTGRRDDARSLLEQQLAICEQRLGPDHRDSLRAMTALGVFYSSDGRREAASLFEKALAGHRRMLGPDHPDTIGAINNLAGQLETAGRPGDALPLFEQCLATNLKVRGPDHPRTAISMANLAGCYSFLGRHAESIRHGEPALALYRRHLPADSEEALYCLNNLAFSYSAVGRHPEAVAAATEAVAGAARIYAPDHPRALLFAWTRVEALVAAGRGAEAVPVIDRCVRLQAGKPGNPGLIPAVMDFRLGHFKAVCDPAGCRATAEMWERLNRPDPDSLFAAARYRAATAGLSADGAADAERAMGWLRKAVAAGFMDTAQLWQSADLDPLRSRPDFRQLLADLGAARETAPKPRLGK